MLPTERGIAAYTSTQRVLSPYPFALDVSLPDPAESARPYLVFPLDAGHMGMVTKLSHLDTSGTVTSEELDYVTIDITGGRPMFSAPAAICAALAPDMVEDVVVRPLDATHQMVAISGATEGCVLRVDSPRARAAARAAGEDGSPRIRIDRQRAVPERARRSGFVPGSGWVSRRARSAPPPRPSRSSRASSHRVT